MPRRVPEELLPHLRRARDLADREYARPLDLTGLAAAAGVSKYHFLRCFTAVYGKTPGVHLTGVARIGRRRIPLTPSEYQAAFAESGAPRIPGCWVFMHGLSDLR